MSWRAQSRSKDAKTLSVERARSENPKPALCSIQRYDLAQSSYLRSHHARPALPPRTRVRLYHAPARSTSASTTPRQGTPQ
jgi:hypothetical protein